MVPAVKFFQLLYLVTVDFRGRITPSRNFRDVLKFFWMVLFVKSYQAVYDVLPDFRRRITSFAHLCHVTSANPQPLVMDVGDGEQSSRPLTLILATGV